MRILAGKYARKSLVLPPESITRPTSGKVREAVFNILGNYTSLEGLKVLDAFAGSGALGLEALSRGAEKAYFMEVNSKAFKILRDNIYGVGAESDCTILRGDATKPREAREACDLVFLDPPYEQELVKKSLKRLRDAGWIGEGSLVVIEYSTREEIELPKFFEALTEKKYGDTILVVGKITSPSSK